MRRTELGPVDAPPKAAGFYWWRRGDEAWRMVQVLDIGRPGQPRFLAYDLERSAFSGRSLLDWASHEAVGQWIGPIERPEAGHVVSPAAPARDGADGSLS